MEREIEINYTDKEPCFTLNDSGIERLSDVVCIPYEILKSKKIKPSSKLLYMAIKRRADNKDYSIAGIRTLSREVGLSNGTVQRSMNELIDNKLIYVKEKRNGYAPRRYVRGEIELNSPKI